MPIKVYWMPIAESIARGYGRVSRQLAWALDSVGVQVLGPYALGWDWLVIPSTPFAGVLNRDGSVRSDVMFHTMFDADFLPPTWGHMLNRSGAIWVPSEWCRENFVNSGVHRPIFVAGYGVDPDDFPSADRSALADRPVTFLHPALAWGDRKNTMMVVKAWHKLGFKADQAQLIIKLNEGAIGKIGIKGMENVYCVKTDLSDKEWALLMQQADCMVYPSSGEGFGLMPLEFACTGGLAIVTDYSGMTEYCHDVPMMTVEVKRIVPAKLYNGIYGAEGRWAEPDIDDLCDKMRHVVSNREMAWAMGRAAATRVRDAWTWKAAGMKARLELEALTNGVD